LKGAPLYRDTLALSKLLLLEVEGGDDFQLLRQRLAKGALRLLDEVTLSFSGIERYEQLQGADAELQGLRAHLLLALELELIDDETFLGFSEQADRSGRK